MTHEGMTYVTSTPFLSEADLVQALTAYNVNSKRVKDALTFSQRIHAQQERKGGGPFLEEHVYPITARVADYLTAVDDPDVERAVTVALLHDTVEDSDDVDLQQITERFGGPVSHWVGLLTKPEKTPESNAEQLDQQYLDGIRQAEFPVRVIKVIDRLNNLASVHKREQADRLRYVAESSEFYLPLAESVDADFSKEMRRLIEEQGKP